MADAGRPVRQRVVRLGALSLAATAVLYGVAGFVSARLARGPTPQTGGATPGAAVRASLPASTAVGTMSAPPPLRTVSGVLSVHTDRSHDASGTFAEVATAARRAGVDFVVLGDHPGDWASAGVTTLRPVRREGVLLVGGLELVVGGVGRLLITGLDTLPPRWDGSVASLMERTDDGGRFVSVIHPRSPRARERWTAVDHLDVDAWEALDVSEMARARLADRWVGYHVVALLGSLVLRRGHESLLRLGREGFRAPGVLAYDSMRARGPLTITGGVNHHPKGRLPGGSFPPYLPFFRTVTNHVLLEGSPALDPVEAWAEIAGALRGGRSYLSLGDAPRARGFRFGAWSGDGRWVEMGEVFGRSAGAHLFVGLPPDARGDLLVRIVRDGREDVWLAGAAGDRLTWPVAGGGVYRVEVYRAGAPLGRWRWNLRPWLLSNPVEFRDGDGRRAGGSVATTVEGR